MHPKTVGDLAYVLLWSVEHRAWWRANGIGYTTKLDEAGLYDPSTVEQQWRRGNEFHKVVRLGAAKPRAAAEKSERSSQRAAQIENDRWR